MIATNKNYLTISEAREELRVSRPTLLKQIECGRLRAMNISFSKKPSYRILIDAWEAFCKSIEIEPQSKEQN